MSVYVEDINGFIDELATNKGYNDLCEWLETYGMELSKEFSEKGYTEFPKQLALEVKIAIHYSPEYWLNPNIGDTVDRFLSILQKCKEVCIVSDGTDVKE